MTRFSKLHPPVDGKPAFETDVRYINQSDMMKCPHFIMMPDHYRADGSCKCNDPNESVMADWGYRWDGKLWQSQEQ